MPHIRATNFLILALSVAPGCKSNDDEHCGDGHVAAYCRETTHSLFVAHEAGALVSYDLSSGAERPGAVQNLSGPVDAQALADGTVLVNLTNNNEILAVNGSTMLELARIRSSLGQAVRPVHGYISPARAGKQYWLALNDGSAGRIETNSAAFMDITAGSNTRFRIVGEQPLGVGHHKGAFSVTSERVVLTNISDCENVVSVYDYSDITSIRSLATLTASVAGWTHSDPGTSRFDPRFCDVTYQRGVPPAPHGCATAKTSGKAYCNLTGSGDLVVVDIDAPIPNFRVMPSTGKGGGYTLSHPGGRYIFTMHESPREGEGGATCQMGQVSVIDASTETVVKALPVFYRGPSCHSSILGTPAATAGLGHAFFNTDGSRLFVPSGGGFMVTDARVDQLIVLDTSDPANPIQLASIQTGVHTGHAAGTLSGDGKQLFIVNAIDSTVSEVDVAALAVTRTFTVSMNPRVVATFGKEEGPGHFLPELP